VTQTQPEEEPTGAPSRYKRSFGGLIGSMIVLVLLVGAFVIVRGLIRDDPEVHPEPVDYLGTVRLAQAAGLDVVYPAELPSGWRATSVESGAVWSVSLLTGSDRYVGVRQVLEPGTDLDELVATYVDEEARQGDAVELESDLAGSWLTFGDADGDAAYAAEVGGAWVLVFGSAPAADLEELVTELTLAPVERG
jgi:hypothetical protein